MRSFLNPSVLLLLRQWKSGEIQLLAFAILMAVICVTSMVFVAGHIQSIIEDKTGVLLGSDRVISSPNSLDPEFEKQARALGLQVTSTLSFLTMLVHQDELALTEVRAVSEDYPLRGVVRSAAQLGGIDEPAVGIPKRGTVWLEARLFPLLEVKIGDKVSIGAATFEVARVLTSEPDRAFEGFNFAPWALMHEHDVPSTLIVQPGSRVNYKLLLAGTESKLTLFESWVKPKLQHNETWIDARHSRPMLNLAVERVDKYLGLVFLINISFSGIAIYMVTRRFIARQFDTVAIIRCFGATRQRILTGYFLSFILLGLITGIVGIGLGYLIEKALIGYFFKEFLDSNAMTLAISPKLGFPVAMGFLTVLVLLLGFALPVLMNLLEITPLRVLRRDLPAPQYATRLGPFFGLLAMLAFMIFKTGEFQLTIVMVFFMLGGSLVTWWLMFQLLHKLGNLQFRTGFSKMLMLICFRNIGRRAKESAFQIIAFALVFGFISALFMIRTDLIQEWEGQIPKDAPNYFAINIPPTELQSFDKMLQENHLKTALLYPMMLARILKVNQDTVDMVEETPTQTEIPNHSTSKKRVFPRLLNITWMKDLPDDNQIIEGKWFEQATGLKYIPVSLEKGFAERMDIKLGDTITLQMGESQFLVQVDSIRTVIWSSFKPNFYIIFPPNVLEQLPNTYMTSFYLSNPESGFIKNLVKQFPMINVIGTAMILAQIKSFLDVALIAIQYLFLFSVVICMVLLLATVFSSLEERIREASLLRLLGLNNRALRSLLLSEFLGLGLVAGIIGVCSAHGLVYWLSTQYFKVAFHFNTLLLIFGPIVAMALVCTGGWVGTRKIFLSPTWRISI